jgi:hypothetical protein
LKSVVIATSAGMNWSGMLRWSPPAHEQ